MISLVTKYSIFALIATGVNLLSQFGVFQIYNGKFSIYIAIAFGTGTGLITKYILDKKYIFYYQTENLQHDIQKFIVYSIMGVLTTIVFWGTEFAFHFLLSQQWAKYLGGMLGLFIGYIIKYNLDKKYVFSQNHQNN